MNRDSLILLLTTVGTVLLAYLIIAIKVAWEIFHDKRWVVSLGKQKLLEYEGLLDKCLETAHIDPNASLSIDSMIEHQGYKINDKLFMLFREAYTSQKPERDVFVCKLLSPERRHFALAHELMHIIFKPNELEEKPRSRNFHSLLKARNENEQIRDYMAACLILRKDSFWEEIMEAKYFDMTPQKRKEFAYKTAKKYNVEPSTVFRRISELKVIMGN